MAKLTTKVAIPIVLIGIFAITVFLALAPEQVNPGFYIIIAFLTIFVFFFGLAIGQNISSPVKKLLDRATELSEGNLTSRVYLPSKDELSQLADVFNKIAEELKVSRDQEANMEKSVGIKVRVKTEELQEVINALEQKVNNRTIELDRLVAESKKLQQETKNKAVETSQLQEELSSVKQKIVKQKKQVAPVVEEKPVENNQEM